MTSALRQWIFSHPWIVIGLLLLVTLVFIVIATINSRKVKMLCKFKGPPQNWFWGNAWEFFGPPERNFIWDF